MADNQAQKTDTTQTLTPNSSTVPQDNKKPGFSSSSDPKGTTDKAPAPNEAKTGTDSATPAK